MNGMAVPGADAAPGVTGAGRAKFDKELVLSRATFNRFKTTYLATRTASTRCACSANAKTDGAIGPTSEPVKQTLH